MAALESHASRPDVLPRLCTRPGTARYDEGGSVHGALASRQASPVLHSMLEEYWRESKGLAYLREASAFTRPRSSV